MKHLAITNTPRVPDRRHDPQASGMTCSACTHVDLDGWTGLEGQAHCSDCHWSWQRKRAAHCPSCHEQFSSYSASDWHDTPQGCRDPNDIPELTWSTTFKAWTTIKAAEPPFPLQEAS
jgi:hypothetical protein